jgi:hypothetical protein
MGKPGKDYAPEWYGRDKWQGHHWIRPTTRLAIYLRDGLACVYCGANVENGAQLSLDHVCARRRARVAVNSPRNLVTACLTCNVKRKDKPIHRFVKDRDMLKVVLAHAKRKPCRMLARVILSARGPTVRAAVQSLASAGGMSAVAAEHPAAAPF